ncbi:MAG: DsbA family protein [Pseudomonadota bacterium]
MTTLINRRTLMLTTGAIAAAGLLSACSSDTSNNELALPDGLQERSLGDPNAPIKMIEYASMTCPHCATFHNRTYKTLKEQYIDTGKVYFSFREFPLDQLAASVAVLARCAPEDRFFDVVDVFFRSQGTWRTNNGAYEKIVEIAKQLGFTKQSVDACLTNQDVIAGVNAIRTHGAEVLKVDATPTFFINGKKVPGAVTIAMLEEEFKPYL